MKASQQSAVGTSAYMVSKNGVKQMLDDYKQNKFTDAVPNIMAKLFPNSRYAAYPMVFHRTAKIGSLVNPQLDDFRKVMFSPALYTLGTIDGNNRITKQSVISNLIDIFEYNHISNYLQSNCRSTSWSIEC